MDVCKCKSITLTNNNNVTTALDSFSTGLWAALSYHNPRIWLPVSSIPDSSGLFLATASFQALSPCRMSPDFLRIIVPGLSSWLAHWLVGTCINSVWNLAGRTTSSCSLFRQDLPFLTSWRCRDIRTYIRTRYLHKIVSCFLSFSFPSLSFPL